jgi:protein-S-isoprenylcysteine O-methyltransferase Ste14
LHHRIMDPKGLQMLAPVRRVVLVVAGAALYLAATLLAWGSIARFFAQPALAAVVAVFIVLTIVGLFAGGSLSAGLREDRRNRWVLAVFGILGVLLAIVPPWSDSRDVMTLGGEPTRWAGVALFAVGGVLRLWPVFVLGHRFSGLVAIQPNHTLMTSGPYRLIRHPSYLGLLLNALGWALAFRSALGIMLAVLHIVPVVARISAEERMLQSEFGADYDAYRLRTSRLIPGIY